MSGTTLPTPSGDLAQLSEQLGHAWGVTCGEPIVQYLAWSESASIFSFLEARGCATAEDVSAGTVLNEEGADALLCVLASLGLVRRGPTGAYQMTDMAREYFVPTSPYYAGAGLYLECRTELPAAYLRSSGSGELPATPGPRRKPAAVRLRVQHSRNFASSVVAARCGEFDHVEHLLDIAGGSGVFAIPLALDRPTIRITLVELPEALDEIRRLLATYGLERRIELVGKDIFHDAWDFPPCDAIYFGNVFHAYSDDECRWLSRKSFESLSADGKIWLHELLFNDNRDGPLLAALWHANMVVRRRGARQRTASELDACLQAAGFNNVRHVPTAGRFSLVGAAKPTGRTP